MRALCIWGSWPTFLILRHLAPSARTVPKMMPSAPRRSPGTSVSPRHRIETLPADWHHFFFTHVGRLRYIPGDQAVAEAVAEADAEGIGGGDSLSFAPGEARARAAAVRREHSQTTILASEGALGETLPERLPQPRSNVQRASDTPPSSASTLLRDCDPTLASTAASELALLKSVDANMHGSAEG
jgi:hypothetical protein